jgi:hypothetical protein
MITLCVPVVCPLPSLCVLVAGGSVGDSYGLPTGVMLSSLGSRLSGVRARSYTVWREGYIWGADGIGPSPAVRVLRTMTWGAGGVGGDGGGEVMSPTSGAGPRAMVCAAGACDVSCSVRRVGVCPGLLS